MALSVRPFDVSMLEEASRLVAERQRRYRQALPALSRVYEEPRQAMALLEADVRERGARLFGVAAFAGTQLAGFLLADMPLPPPRSFLGIYFPSHIGRVSYTGWGVGTGFEREAIRALYAQLAPTLIERGAFHHITYVGAHDRAVQSAWHSLGFGRRVAVALRDTAPVATASPADGIAIRRGTPADLENCVRMVSDNDRHHATSPMFEPFMPETPAVHDEVLLRLLRDPACSAWLAEDASGRCLGIQTYSVNKPSMQSPEHSVHLEDGFSEPEARGRGVGTALLDAGMKWARSEGHDWCTVTWNTDNLLGARFWQSHGFRPTVYRLRRSVDPRISWASTRP